MSVYPMMRNPMRGKPILFVGIMVVCKERRDAKILVNPISINYEILPTVRRLGWASFFSLSSLFLAPFFFSLAFKISPENFPRVGESPTSPTPGYATGHFITET